MTNLPLILNGIIGTEKLLGCPTFTWKNETFRCVPNTVHEKIKSSDAGFTDNTDFRMTVRLNQFTPNIYPQPKDYITYLGYTMLIKEVMKPGHGVFYVYVCEAPTIE